MATSSPSPNNVTVKFRGKGEREMPKPPNMDVSTVAGPKGGKPKFPRGLKKKAKRLQGQGRISDKAMKKITGEA